MIKYTWHKLSFIVGDKTEFFEIYCMKDSLRDFFQVFKTKLKYDYWIIEDAEDQNYLKLKF